MASLTEYWGQAKAGFGNIDPKDMADLGEDWMIVAATGAAVGLASAAIGGLDKKVFGFPVPIDGVISVGLGVAGLQMKNRYLKVASLAAGGSAAVRTFETFFKRGLKVKGEFEDLGSGMTSLAAGFSPAPQFGPGVGFGQGAQDRLVEAARYL